MSLRFVSIHLAIRLKLLDSRYKDETDHEDSASLLLIGDVAGTDAEKTRNDVWWNLERC